MINQFAKSDYVLCTDVFFYYKNGAETPHFEKQLLDLSLPVYLLLHASYIYLRECRLAFKQLCHLGLNLCNFSSTKAFYRRRLLKSRCNDILCDNFGINEEHLTRLFKSTFGAGPKYNHQSGSTIRKHYPFRINSKARFEKHRINLPEMR